MLTLLLENCPNPDFNESYRTQRFRVKVPDLRTAVAVARKFIEDNSLGGGNFSSEVLDGKKYIARISYNGRVWAPGGKEILL
jgi:hypothetical protein